MVVIETKRYAGHISCHNGRWFQNGLRIRSVGRQANRGAIAIKRFLSEEHPQLKGTALRWVHSLVVFTHPLCSLELDRPDATTVRSFVRPERTTTSSRRWRGHLLIPSHE